MDALVFGMSYSDLDWLFLFLAFHCHVDRVDIGVGYQYCVAILSRPLDVGQLAPFVNIIIDD